MSMVDIPKPSKQAAQIVGVWSCISRFVRSGVPENSPKSTPTPSNLDPLENMHAKHAETMLPWRAVVIARKNTRKMLARLLSEGRAAGEKIRN